MLRDKAIRAIKERSTGQRNQLFFRICIWASGPELCPSPFYVHQNSKNPPLLFWSFLCCFFLCLSPLCWAGCSQILWCLVSVYLWLEFGSVEWVSDKGCHCSSPFSFPELTAPPPTGLSLAGRGAGPLAAKTYRFHWSQQFHVFMSVVWSMP